MGRRPDGYHELDTLAVFAAVGDEISVSPADELTLAVSGPLAAHGPAGHDNLVMTAARLLKEHARFPRGAAVRLRKNLPAGAGLGGGSADAAAALHALNRLWGLGLGLEQLTEIGRRVGADVPMCLVGRALRARGAGDRIELRADWPALPLVLVWPGRPVSTAAAFAGLRRRENPPLPPPTKIRTPSELADFLGGCRNDLEEPARALAPEIGDALAALRHTPGRLLARMSGSGSACFGLYAERAEAAEAARAIAIRRPGWWVAATLANAPQA